MAPKIAVDDEPLLSRPCFLDFVVTHDLQPPKTLPQAERNDSMGRDIIKRLFERLNTDKGNDGGETWTTVAAARDRLTAAVNVAESLPPLLRIGSQIYISNKDSDFWWITFFFDPQAPKGLWVVK